VAVAGDPRQLTKRFRWRWRRPGFSRWSILAVAGMAVFLSGPAQTYGVSAFVDPMLADLHLSRSLF
jgi:hypothetical protein